MVCGGAGLIFRIHNSKHKRSHSRHVQGSVPSYVDDDIDNLTKQGILSVLLQVLLLCYLEVVM